MYLRDDAPTIGDVAEVLEELGYDGSLWLTSPQSCGAVQVWQRFYRSMGTTHVARVLLWHGGDGPHDYGVYVHTEYAPCKQLLDELRMVARVVDQAGELVGAANYSEFGGEG